MLCIRRNVNETIFIGGDIRIMLLEIVTDHSARIGIDAPRSIPVHRSEILRSVLAEGKIVVPSIGEMIATLQAENERLKAEFKTLKEQTA